MERIKEVWPKWEGLEILGEGGFGIVYKAKKDSFAGEEFSAIKIVKIPHNESEHDEMMSSGFSNENIKEYYHKSVMNLVDEIKLMQKMKAASHVVSIEDYEVVENKDGIGYTIFIRMELLTNIAKYFREKEITVQEVVKMATHILTALEFCHDQNIMHRDIKPANIFISEFKEYKLGDFGVSREVERTNATMSQKGTKSYMAPEMVRMEKYGKNIDIYALGLTMYELLNHGRMPFLPPFPEMFLPSDREEANYKRLSGEEFPDIEGIGELNTIIKKACHPLKEKRYQSAKEMKNDLMKLDLNDGVKKEETLVQDNFVEEKTAGLFDNDIFSNNESKMDIADDKTLNVFNENTFLFNDKTLVMNNQENNIQNIDDIPLIKTTPVDYKCSACGRTMYLIIPGVYCCTYGGYAYSYRDCSQYNQAKAMDSSEKTGQFLELYNQIIKETDIDNQITILNKMYMLDPHDYHVIKFIAHRYKSFIINKTNKENDVKIFLSLLNKLVRCDMENGDGLGVFTNTGFLGLNTHWSQETKIIIETYKRIHDLLNKSQKYELSKEVYDLWDTIAKNAVVDYKDNRNIDVNNPNKCPVCGSDMEVIFSGIKECTHCDYMALENNDPKTKSLFDDYQDVIKFSKQYDMRIFALSWMRRMYVNCSKEELIKVQHKRNLASYAIDDVINLKKTQKQVSPLVFEELHIYERDNRYDSLQSMMEREFNIPSSETILMILTSKNMIQSNTIFTDKGIYFKGEGQSFYVSYFELAALDVKRSVLSKYSIFYNKQKIKHNFTEHEIYVWYTIMNNMKNMFHIK